MATHKNADALEKEDESKTQSLDEDLKFWKPENVWMLDVCLISIVFLVQKILMLPKNYSSWALLKADLKCGV